ncbi:MAG: 30S ribosomal protein S18 [Holosporales bacterium]|nr:30S ribosomal protein S18 [Holosporales bacterium]
MENSNTEKVIENTVQETQEKKLDLLEIDYKDIRSLSKYISERGKIIPSRVSNIPIKRQREIAKAIKRARILALIPFVSEK